MFGPLGMSHTAYNPPAAWRASIPPTADDRSFRHRIIQGEVHDENASVLGGVAGHAGLFATAEDVATFAHALLQGGAFVSSRDSGAVHSPGNLASRHFPSLGLGHTFLALAVWKIFLPRFLRTPGIYRNLALDRSRAPAFHHPADQPDLARLQQSKPSSKCARDFTMQSSKRWKVRTEIAS